MNAAPRAILEMFVSSTPLTGDGCARSELHHAEDPPLYTQEVDGVPWIAVGAGPLRSVYLCKNTFVGTLTVPSPARKISSGHLPVEFLLSLDLAVASGSYRLQRRRAVVTPDLYAAT